MFEVAFTYVVYLLGVRVFEVEKLDCARVLKRIVHVPQSVVVQLRQNRLSAQQLRDIFCVLFQFNFRIKCRTGAKKYLI